MQTGRSRPLIRLVTFGFRHVLAIARISDFGQVADDHDHQLYQCQATPGFSHLAFSHRSRNGPLLYAILGPERPDRIVRKSWIETLYAYAADRWHRTIGAGAIRIVRAGEQDSWCRCDTALRQFFHAFIIGICRIERVQIVDDGIAVLDTLDPAYALIQI